MQTGFCTLQSTNRTGFLLMHCKQNNFQDTKCWKRKQNLACALILSSSGFAVVLFELQFQKMSRSNDDIQLSKFKLDWCERKKQKKIPILEIDSVSGLVKFQSWQLSQKLAKVKNLLLFSNDRFLLLIAKNFLPVNWIVNNLNQSYNMNKWQNLKQKHFKHYRFTTSWLISGFKASAL